MHVRMRAYVQFDARVYARLQRTLRLAKGQPHAATFRTERNPLFMYFAPRGSVDRGLLRSLRAEEQLRSLQRSPREADLHWSAELPSAGGRGLLEIDSREIRC